MFASSIKLNQKLQVNIKDDIVPVETTEANETFNKMASMLREVYINIVGKQEIPCINFLLSSVHQLSREDPEAAESKYIYKRRTLILSIL